MDAFHFIRPLWLLALLPWLGLSVACLRHRTASGNWTRVCDPALLPFVLETSRAAVGRWLAPLVTIGGCFLIVALAGPAWERAPQPTFRDETPMVLVLDLSASMYADDLSPDRISRVRFKLADLLKDRDAGRAGATALVVFAGEAFTVTPLTDDTDTILAMLPALEPDLMPVPGSRPDLAIRLAIDLLSAAPGPGDILLVSDEAGSARDVDAVDAAIADGHRLSVLGVGTAGGAPVPLPDGSGFLRDDAGRVVVPRLEAESLRRLADRGNGIFVAMSSDDLDLLQLGERMHRQGDVGSAAATDRDTDAWREEGPWLVLFILPFIAMLFRRGYLLALLLVVAPATDTRAADWASLWQRPDQRAQSLYREGDAEAAAETFENPRWKAAAEHQIGRYEEAIESLDGLDDTESLYNKGNALARLGRYDEAIASYEAALQEDPGHDDARFNRDLLIEQQNQEQQQQQSQQNEQQSGQENEPSQSDQSEPAEDSGDEQEESASANDQQSQDQQESGERPEQMPSQQADESLDEEAQASEQWLRSIPDDPGGLLRRKFYYQSRQREKRNMEGEKTW